MIVSHLSTFDSLHLPFAQGFSVVPLQPPGARQGSEATTCGVDPRRCVFRPFISAVGLTTTPTASAHPDPAPLRGHSRVEAELALVLGALAAAVLAVGGGAVPRHGGQPGRRGWAGLG